MNSFIKVIFAFATGIAAAIAAPASDAPASMGPAEMKTDDEGHVLVSLWKGYKAASDADKPKTQQEILERIMTEAKSKGYLWDYACGAAEWYNVTVSMNWRLQDKSGQRIRDDVEEIDNPLLTYYMKRLFIVNVGGSIDAEWFRSNVAERAGELRQSCNSGFYRGLDSKVHSFVIASVSNDYEFLLWSGFAGGISEEVSAIAQNLLVAEVAEYPLGAYVEFRQLITDNLLDVDDKEAVSKRLSVLRAFSEKYSGKAIALLSDQQILIDRMKCLADDGEIVYKVTEDDPGTLKAGEATEADFKALRADCADLVKRRKSFGGQEAKIAADIDEVDKLIEHLDRQSISVSAEDDEVTILMKNVEEVKLAVMLGDTTVHEARIVNPTGSYFLADTVKYALPALSDGDYEIKCTCGEITSSADYDMTSISVAYRTIDTGIGVYIADYETGKPISRANLEILHNWKIVRAEKDFCSNGFTSIQEIFDSGTTRNKYFLRFSYTDENGLYRRSKELSFWFLKDRTEAAEAEEPERGRIFLDRAAFNPGDTLYFKAIAYIASGDEFSVLEEGRELALNLTDPDGNTVQSASLKTNEFGSVNGSMSIPEDAKGGTWTLSLHDGKTRLTDARLTVDEFVLPTFELAFDPTETAYFGGDTVSVKGKLTSYSGHSLSTAKIAYEINSYVNKAKTLTGNLKAASDGSFEIRFAADTTDDPVSYHVTVRVTDLTGETLEWSKTVRVNPRSALKIDLTGTAEGNLLISGKNPGSEIMQGDELGVKFNANIGGLDIQPEIPVSYVVRRWTAGAADGDELLSGTVVSGREIAIDLAGYPSGLYLLEAEAEYISEGGHCVSLESSVVLLKTSEDDETVAPGVEYFYKKMDDSRVVVQLGTCERERWFVAEVYGGDRQLLYSEIFSIGTDDRAVTLLDYGYDTDWPDKVQLVLFSFKDSGSRKQSFMFERGIRPEDSLPLSFIRFTDKSLPRAVCDFTLQTNPDVEAVVSVFDKSTERIRANRWSAVRRYVSGFSTVGIYARNGSRELDSGYGYFWRQHSVGSILMARSANVMEEKVVMDSSLGTMYDEAAEEESTEAEVTVREQFDNTLAFLPCLRSDDSGQIGFSVTPTDKLSTYYVSVFAHDARMRSNVLRQEMVVSVPVKVSLALPQFLYCGDSYSLKTAVFSAGEEACSGVLSVEVYDTEDYKGTASSLDGGLDSGVAGTAVPIMKFSQPLDVAAGGAAQAEFAIEVPEGVSVLGVKVSFVSGNVTDAVFDTVPVYETVQTLTEAHSALLLSGMDADSLRASLASQFTGVSAETVLAALAGQSAGESADSFAASLAGTGFSYREVLLKDMILEAIPQKVSTEQKDVLSLSEALYVGLLAQSLAASGTVSPDGIAGGSETSVAADSASVDAKVLADFDSAGLIEKISACQNSDGGFGWYEGFRSSPILTAVVLERFALLRDKGLLTLGLAAVKYLDNNRIATKYPIWCGGLTLRQYLYVRSMYADVEFSPVVPKRITRFEYRKRISKLRKEVKDYLLPKKERGLEGEILSKARRVAVSLALSESSAFSSGLGLGSSSKKLQKSAAADMVSLAEYAVEHSSGGIYYPNAVMPFRGLLESEAYAHSLLCDLCEDYFQRTGDNEYHRIAEGIRLWLMVQKESQQWDDDPAYVNAISSVLDGSQEVLSSRVAILSKQYTKPFCEIAAAGNGFTVERKFYRYTTEAASSGVASDSAAAASDAPGNSAITPREGEVSGLTEGKIVRTEIKDGDTLSVGDRIVAEYRIWNEENRSFVQLETPRYAALRPVNQLSGCHGGLLRAVSVAPHWFTFTPASYREVKADRTLWYFDVCPEETTTITEEFFVTQSGTFSCPTVTIESVYAPHYRANDSATPPLAVD